MKHKFHVIVANFEVEIAKFEVKIAKFQAFFSNFMQIELLQMGQLCEFWLANLTPRRTES